MPRNHATLMEGNAMSQILVVGANGTVGSELVRLLQGGGHEVRRATSRAATQPGEVQLDLVTQQGLAQAFEGVERAFLLAPPGHVNQDALLNPLIAEAARRGLKKVVLMSAMGANADENGGLRKAEVQLERSGVPYNIIRPNWFMQNFNTFWLHGIQAVNKILLPVGQAKGSFIDARDIAAVAAELLTGNRFDNRDFDLTGPRALNHDEVAAVLARETGRPITFEDITPEAMRTMLLDAQLPRDYAEFMLVILGFFKAGYAERTTDAVQQVTGRAPRSIEQYAKDYRASWAG
jgi:uncharacterized protein YbjT (DUF2867 family)